MKGNNVREYREVTSLPTAALSVSDYADQRKYRSTSTIYNVVREVISGKKTWQQLGYEVVRYKGFNYIIPLT